MRRQGTVRFVAIGCAFAIAAGMLPGCGPKPPIKIPTTTQIAGYEDMATQISEDPVKFLREVLVEARKLDQFTMQFERRERLGLGLLKELQPAEHIFAEYRNEPFSVRFTWLDEKSEYQQCVYVHGQHSNQVTLLPRHGLFGLPPSVARAPAPLAVVFGKTRNPITDFGPRRMVERTLDRIEKAQKLGEVKFRLLPATEIGLEKEPCFHIEIRYPKQDEFACKLHDFYVHTRTLLPVASYLWLPGKDERSSETLDAMYVYGDLDPNVELADANFEIDKKSIAAIVAAHGKRVKAIEEGNEQQASTAARSVARQDADADEPTETTQPAE